jgi:hypothetical protein
MRRPRVARYWIALATLGWIAAVAVGLSRLLAYESAPGDSGLSPRRWPARSRLRRDPYRPTLVMIAHPRCPCTRASLAELSRAMVRCSDRAAVHVLFVVPPGVPRGWERADLWRQAAAIPVARVHRDDGSEARLFGARTSGHVALYDARGTLLYSGGITAARGHEGDNAGSRAVVRLIRAASAAAPRRSRSEPGAESLEPGATYVFGCPLR